MRSLLRHSVKVISAAVLFLTLLAYLCPLVNPARFHWPAFFGTAFPWILSANLLLILVWAWRKNRIAWYHAGVLLLGLQHITGFVGLHFDRPTVSENDITIATHNLGGLFRGQKMTDALREKMASSYAKFLQENGFPDILCTQETGEKFYKLLASKMGYPHTFNLNKGTVILSRYPIEAGGDIPFKKTANSTLWADIRAPGGKLIRVYNVHLQSNKVTNTTEKVLEEADFDDQETWRDIKFVLTRVGKATGIRADQAQSVRDHVDECKLPTIICGDFNDTPQSYVYALLSGGFTDTFREKGFGLGTTFSGILPLLRIDYILVEKSFEVHACRTVRGDYSDHYPVFVSLGLGK